LARRFHLTSAAALFNEWGPLPGICERFHKTVLDEFYRVAFRKKIYRSLEELQEDLDEWLRYYNEERTHQGRWCYGKTPMQTVSVRRRPSSRCPTLQFSCPP